MPYGSGKRLGETIDPRLMMADFSGFERAGQIMGQGFANAGKQIGDTIKENTQKQNDISAGIKMATAIKQAVPELSPIADEVLGQLSNPDLSTNQKIQSLAGIKEAMQISLLGKQETRADAALAIQKAELAAKIAAAGNKSPQGTFMTREEFSSLANSGVPIKGVPTQDGRIYVTDISGNQPGILGSNVAMVNGQPTRVPTPQIKLPAWGAGANIQNALPQGQGGIFPDNVPTTGLPIGEAVEFTPGVSVDGTPGVLPPKEQPVIPAGEVPKGDVYSVKDGEVGVTRLPGSTPELEFQIKQAALEKAKLESGQIKGEKEKENKEITQAKDNFSSYVSEMANAYSSLFKKGGAVSAGQSNIGSMIMGTDLGQVTGRVLGTETQVMRDMITTMTPNLINVIRQSTQMGAKGMDTPKELEFYLRALGDVNLPIEASVKALDTLDKIYGNGQTVPNILKDNPALMEKVKKSGLTFKGEETPTDKKGSSFIQDESILSDLEEYRKRKNQ